MIVGKLRGRLPSRVCPGVNFSSRLIEVFNSGALALMISIGHRSGLFRVMAELPPAGSEEIAARVGLNERYVREWLGAMVVGRIVSYEPEYDWYLLPGKHAEVLNRSGAGAQFIPLVGAVEDRLLECFRNGGGVPLEAYERFHEIMAEESGSNVLPRLIGEVLPRAELTEHLRVGIDVLDVGCGCGRALNHLACAFPRSRFTGYDSSDKALSVARAEATGDNVRFERKDVARLSARGGYDLVTAFDSIHAQAEPGRVLDNVYAALRGEGVFLMQEVAASSRLENNVDHPLGALLYTLSCMLCMSVSLSEEGAGLGAMWGHEKAREALLEAGFGSIDVHQLSGDIQNSYFVVRK